MTHLREAVGLLNSLPLAGLMLVITAGFLLGRASWRGFSLGPAGGTLAAALALGSMGLSVRALYGSDDPRLTLELPLIVFKASQFIQRSCEIRPQSTHAGLA